MPTASNPRNFYLKNLLVRLFAALGLEIRRSQRPASDRGTLTGALAQLVKLGWNPATVIDVGVAYHTAELYRQFPRSQFLLVEPLREFESDLQQICREYRAEYVLAAAGEKPGSTIINVRAQNLDCSSTLKEAEGPMVDGTPRQVPVVTLDQLCIEKNPPSPYLIKVDVQGAELQVLRGAQKALLHTDVVLLEVSLLGMLIDGPQLFDVVSAMKQYGFVVYDVWGFNYRPFDGALCQLDMAFVREHGPFRKHSVFATPQQRTAMASSLDHGGRSVPRDASRAVAP